MERLGTRCIVAGETLSRPVHRATFVRTFELKSVQLGTEENSYTITSPDDDSLDGNPLALHFDWGKSIQNTLRITPKFTPNTTLKFFSCYIMSYSGKEKVGLRRFRSTSGETSGPSTGAAGGITAKYDPEARDFKLKVIFKIDYYGDAPSPPPPLPPSSVLRVESQLQADFLRLLEKGDDADATFLVMDMEIKAHRTILTARSDYFRSLFASGSEESRTGFVKITDVEPSVFKEFLCFVYSGSDPVYDGDSTYKLLAVADKFVHDDLKGKCEALICRNLTADNLIDALLLADLHRCSGLRSRARGEFLKYVDYLKTQSKWEELKKSPALLLSLLEHMHKKR